MDFEIFDDPAQALWRFSPRDRDQPRIELAPGLLQWNLIELPKLDRLRLDRGAGHDADTLAAWVRNNTA